MQRNVGAIPRTRFATSVQFGVACGFDLFVHTQCRPRVTHEPSAELRPGTIVVFSHKRDLDVPLLVHAIFRRLDLPRWVGRIAFAGRSDLFLPGFLALRFPELGPLRRPLAGASLAGILGRMNIVPVAKAGPRLMGEWLRPLDALFGDSVPIERVLSPAALQAAAAVGLRGGRPLSAAGDWRYHRFLEWEAGPESLQPAVLQRLRVHEAHVARDRLDELAARLRDGWLVVLAPEGELSPDGRLQRFHSGLYRLLQQVPGSPVLPIAITYDLLSQGRPTAFVRVGAPLQLLPGLSRRESDALVRGRLVNLQTVTLAQLVADMLMNGPTATATEIPRTALMRAAFKRARDLAADGRPVDHRLLDRRRFTVRMAEFFEAAHDHGLEAAGDTVRIDRAFLARPVNGWEENPLGYALNEAVGR